MKRIVLFPSPRLSVEQSVRSGELIGGLVRRRDMRLMVALLILTVCAACTPGPSATTIETFAVAGYVHAGPTCPVMKTPPDPNCADRPVPDAEIAVVGTNGTEVIRVSTDENGRFDVILPAGTYILIPQPVKGLVGTAPEQPLTVPADADLDVAYDTGIR